MINLFKDKDAVVEVGECEGGDGLFIRLLIQNGKDKFIFHLTKEQYETVRKLS